MSAILKERTIAGISGIVIMQQQSPSGSTSGSTSRSPSGSLGSAGCVLIPFGSAFAGMGLLLFIATFRSNKPDPNAWVGIFVGLLFMCVGGAIIALGVAAMRAGRYTSTAQRQVPDEPWRWNKKWATGVIPDDSGVSNLTIWLFAIFWNAISFPTVFIALKKGDAGNAIWLVLLFPLIGIGLLTAAFYATAQRWKYGRCELELETMPGRIGGWIAGTIQTSTVMDVSGGIKIALKCVNRVTAGGGKNSGTSEYVLWQEQQTLAGKLPRLGSGLGLPVAFQIPSDCLPTRDDSRNAIVWRLVATASEPGIDFKTTF